MLKEKVFEIIRLHVEEYAVCAEIDENTSLMDDLRMDALDIVEVMYASARAPSAPHLSLCLSLLD